MRNDYSWDLDLDYIAHRRSGLHYETKASHKYYKRISTGNKKKPYLYFYTKAQYQAYLKGGNTGRTSKSPVTRRRKNSVLDSIRSVMDKALSSFKRVVDSDGNGKWDLVDKVEAKTKKKKTTPSTNTNRRTTTTNNSNSRDGHDTPTKDHKYIAKLLINGKYRYFYTQAELNAYYNRNPQAKAERETMSEFGLIDHAETEEESMAEVNKNFQKSMSKDGMDLEPGWSTNCYDCSLAWEARRRGYDVEAQYDPNGGSPDEIASFYEGVESYINDDGSINTNSGWDTDVVTEQKARNGKETMQETADMLNEKYEDGARGCLNVFWEGGGGHNVAWEKKDGEIYIHDAQNNTTEKMKDYSKADYIAANCAIALRTDDKTMTKNAANYLEPNDNVDEAKNNRNVTYNYDVKDIDDMLDHYNPSTQQYTYQTDDQLNRWQKIINKSTELNDPNYWTQEKTKKEVYGDE